MNTIQFDTISPIFIVGAGRSGTTLLQRLLTAHPNIALFGELHFFSKVLQFKRWVPEIDTPSRQERFFDLFLASASSLRYVPGARQVFTQARERLLQVPAPTYEHFYRFVMEEYAWMHGAARFGEKTPENVRFLQELTSIFPRCKVIHIVRDPRDVVTSLLDMPWAANDVVVNTLKWRFDVECGQLLRDRPETYLEVRYRELVLEPEIPLRRILAWLGEPYHGEVLDFYQNTDLYLRQEEWNQGTFQPVYQSSVGRWRSQLPPSRVYLVERLAAAQMARLGYERSEVGLREELAAPLLLLAEVISYGTYKVRELTRRRRQKKHSPYKIHGENRRLKAMFKRALLGRR